MAVHRLDEWGLGLAVLDAIDHAMKRYRSENGDPCMIDAEGWNDLIDAAFLDRHARRDIAEHLVDRLTAEGWQIVSPLERKGAA